MVSGKKVIFDLSTLFPNFLELTKPQKHVIQYGVKQLCSDKTAKKEDEALTEDERIVAMKQKFEDVLAGKSTERKATVTKKIDTAWDSASTEERAMMVKLGLHKPEDVK